MPLTASDVALLSDALSCKICVVETGTTYLRAVDIARMGEQTAKELGLSAKSLDVFQQQLVVDLETLRKRLRGW